MINFLDYDGLLYWKQKIQTWGLNTFALKKEIPTKLPANGGNADTVSDHTVSDHTVEKDVPADAKYTDTVYSHPDAHPAAMITEDSAHRFITDAEQTKYESAYTHRISSHAPTYAEKNAIVGISIDSTTRKVNLVVPTKTSELTNNSNFITTSEVSQAINDAISGITGMEFVVLASGEYNTSTLVPSVTGQAGKIYLVPNNGAAPNVYTEYIYKFKI